MFRNKENIIIGLLIVLLFGNTFMSYRNYMIAREGDRLARAEADFLVQNAPAWNATYQWAQGGATAGIFPTSVQIAKQLQAQSVKK